jgi:hypothetical protein
MRLIKLGIAAVVAAVASLTGPVAPAQAGPDPLFAPWCNDPPLICRPVKVPIIHCPPFCPVDIWWRWRWPPEHPDWMLLLNEEIATSMQQLGDGSRAAALNSFQAASNLVTFNQLAVDQVGRINPDNNQFEPQPIPWLQAAGEDIVDGITFLQLGRANPQAGGYTALAAAQFDEAYTEFSQQRVISG